ncbi:uncharacterized protein LOC125489826 [Plutella xylostella]|uniref:uncharacterized protein LOC125489826 n=1 Tax=Plutella xylostella TaxID=51655 RepID=UPI002032B8FC|nr:uncharacterized protein LOC125489826 [Plutella xylostella]XP_048483038.1 uncharacterized protein LOC125489826 [Plutella xylostella]
MGERPICFNLLLKDELTYEATVRGVKPEATADQLRLQLTELATRMPSDEVIYFEGDVTSELEKVKNKIKDLQNSLSKPNLQLKHIKRCESLANHLYHRLGRINAVSKEETCMLGDLLLQLESRDSELRYISKAYQEQEKKQDIPVVGCIEPCPKVDHTQIQKLNLVFNGSDSVQAFVQRLEELCNSRGISEETLFNSVAEIFSGDALFWFRGVKEEVSSWKEVKARLYEEFLPFDYNRRLLQEVRSRTQGADESIIKYLSTMRNYFSRLSVPLPESEQLEIVQGNLRPFYTSQLALTNVENWNELKERCRQLEYAKYRADSFAEPPRVSANSVAPDLAYQARNRLSVNAVDTEVDLFCVRCRVLGHGLCQCSAPPTQLCYSCGLKGATLSTCPRCGPSVAEPPKPQQKPDSAGPTVAGVSVNNEQPGTKSSGSSSRRRRRRRRRRCRRCEEAGDGDADIGLRPYLDVAIYHHRCRGLLDSGSTVSVIGGKAAQSLSSCGTLYPAEEKSIVTANGSHSPVSGFKILPVTVEDVTAFVKFYVVPDISSELLLGIDFWRAFNIAPDVLNLLNKRGVSKSREPYASEVRHLNSCNELSASKCVPADNTTASLVVRGRRSQDCQLSRVRRSMDSKSYLTASLTPNYERYTVVQQVSGFVYILEDSNGNQTECHARDILCRIDVP